MTTTNILSALAGAEAQIASVAEAQALAAAARQIEAAVSRFWATQSAPSLAQQAMRNHGDFGTDIPFGMNEAYYLATYAGSPPPAPVPATEAEREAARNLPRGVDPVVARQMAADYSNAWAKAHMVGPRKAVR
jgi:alkylation response protein AidB-like acyl-CoA dehydrogenase